MKRIISIFLLLSAFAVCRADYVRHPDSELRFALSRLVRYIRENFKVAGRNYEVNIITDDKVPPGAPRYEIKQRQYYIYINPMDDFRRDEFFCLRLICMLLRAKSGCSAGNLADLPDWFVCGMTQVVIEQTRGAMIVRNQHTFTLLDTLAENGCFGNPVDILNVDLKQLSGAEKMFFAEYSKLVMLALDKTKGFHELSAIIGGDPVIDRKKFNGVALKALNDFDEELISPIYRRIMWGELLPPPEKFTGKCLEKVIAVDVPELDIEGVPTGKLMKVPLENLQTLVDRDDFLFICRRVITRLYTISAGESRQVRKLIADMRYLIETEFNYQKSRWESVERDENLQQTGRKTAKNTAIVKSGGKKNSRLLKPEANKSLQKNKNTDVLFDELMNNSSGSDFKRSIRDFYQMNVVSKKLNGYGKITGTFGITKSKFNSKAVSRCISDIKSALADRAALREYLDKEIFMKTPIHEMIKFRKEFIYGQDENPHAIWLDRIDKELY